MKLHIRLHLILKPFRNSKYRPLLLAAGLLLGGCNALPAWCAESAGSRVPAVQEETKKLPAALEEAKKLPGLPECTGQMPLSYAEEFRVDYYGEDYALITIHSDDRYLLVSEGADVPADLPEDITVLQKPLEHIYAASSSCPDFFRQLGALDAVTMTSTQAKDWTIAPIRKAAEREDMIYVGKYSAPDYEYICDEGCSLAIENTMVYHAPQVLEMLKRLGIPVLCEYSSYEEEPLGRLEWIRLYGLLTDRQEAADSYFEEQLSRMREVLDSDGHSGLPAPEAGQEETASDREESTEAADVVFFYIASNGSVNVRREEDYVSRMIDMAGGRYLLHDVVADLPAAESHTGSVSLQMESFYAAARDADVLIYNGTLGEPLEHLDELLRKSPLLADFKAVKNGRVYCSRESLFQEVTGTCRMIEDFFHVIRQHEEEDLIYLRKLD